MTKDNNSSNYTEKNRLDASDFYGLAYDVGCTGSSCIPNAASDVGDIIPSLKEIASYNQAAAAGITSSGADMYKGPLEKIPAVNELEKIDESQQALSPETLQTPAMVFNYGATTDSGIKEATTQQSQITDYSHPYPITEESIQYLNGFLRTQIGRRVTIDFLVGSNSIVSKSGYLLGVAANYIVINELDTNDITTCDFYNIKFIRFYY